MMLFIHMFIADNKHTICNFGAIIAIHAIIHILFNIISVDSICQHCDGALL